MAKKNETVVELAPVNEPGNLDFWNDVEETDPKYTKHVGYGAHKFTAIDAYYQIKNATAIWGQYGKHWGLFNMEYQLIGETPLMQLFAEFVYPFTENGEIKQVSFPISTAIKIADNKGTYDADFAKKIETSLITKALSRLGFNADIFLGKFDDNVYKDSMVEKFTTPTGEVIDIDHSEEQEKKFHALLKDENALNFYIYMRGISLGAVVSLNKTFPKGKIVAMKAVAVKLEARGKEDFDQYLSQMTERIIAGDDFGLVELGEEVGAQAKEFIFSWLSDEHQQMAREMFQSVED